MRLAVLAVALVATLASLYESPLRRGTLLNYDDSAVLTPMRDVHSFAQYQQMHQQNLILDLQPVRDAVSWLEFRVQDQTGLYNPQLVNFALWILILTSLGALLAQLSFVRSQGRTLLVGLFLIGAHPVAVNSVAWPSARKHLLAALLILIATLAWHRVMSVVVTAGEQRHRAWLWAFLATLASWASGLAQPIHLLWVFWAGLFVIRLLRSKEGKQIQSVAGLWLINLAGTLGLMYANWQYYAGSAYAARSGAAKLANESWSLWWSDRVEAIGRYALQLAFPISPSISSYQRHHLLNWIGAAALLATAGFFYWRWRQNPERWAPITQVDWRRLHSIESPTFWLSLAALPLILVHARSTEHLGWDTYLLFPWLMMGGLLISQACRRLDEGRWKVQRIAVFALVLGSLWSVQTWWSARAWSDEGRLWSTAVARGEKTLALSGWSRWALQNNEIDRGCEAALELFDLHPRHKDLDYLLGLCFYSLGEKNRNPNRLNLFSRITPPENTPRPWFEYYWAVSEMNLGQRQAAFERISRMWATRTPSLKAADASSIPHANSSAQPDFAWRFAFNELTSGIAANSLIICCRSQPAAICRELKSFIRKNALPRHWDWALWEKTLAQASLPDDECRQTVMKRD